MRYPLSFYGAPSAELIARSRPDVIVPSQDSPDNYVHFDPSTNKFERADDQYYCALKGREPRADGLTFGDNPGAVGPSELPWRYLRSKDPIIWRNGVGLPISMIPRELAPADVIDQIDELQG